MIFPHLIKNQFTKEERKLPVEFDYPYVFKLTTILNIPNGYQVEDIPKPTIINLDKDACSCVYNIIATDNQIQVKYTFSLNRIQYSKEEYASLRKLWGIIVDKNNQQIVLKRTESKPATVRKQTSQL